MILRTVLRSDFYRTCDDSIEFFVVLCCHGTEIEDYGLIGYATV
jgi:hypothetical protein